MNIICLDFGLKRIGVAIGSTSSGIAFERDYIANTSEVFTNLQDIVDREKVEKVLVGMPFKQDGQVGDIDEQLRKFVSKLKRQLKIDVEMVDERYSTKIAQAKLQSLHIKAADQKQRIDSLAAQILLQQWLDSRE